MAKRRRRRRRKNRGGFILSFLTFCIVAGAIIGSIIVFLKVNEIQVTGTTRYKNEEIIETSGIEMGDNMFLVNKFDVARRILEAYPYIEEIKIRRRLPDAFTFEIKERVPSAYIESDGNRWLIDNNSYILEMLAPDASVKVPKITGGKVITPHVGSSLILENQDQMPVLCEVLTALRQTNMAESITRVEIDKLYDVKLVYGNRFLVNLGDITSLSKKIEMLRAVVNELTEFDKGTINVSAVREARFKPDNGINLAEKPPVAQQEQQPKAENTSEGGEPNEEKGSEKTEN